jgi:hypothetical protein
VAGSFCNAGWQELPDGTLGVPSPSGEWCPHDVPCCVTCGRGGSGSGYTQVRAALDLSARARVVFSGATAAWGGPLSLLPHPPWNRTAATVRLMPNSALIHFSFSQCWRLLARHSAHRAGPIAAGPAQRPRRQFRAPNADGRMSNPISSPETTSSTRRFCCRPAEVALVDTGRCLPNPSAVIETVGIPAWFK